MALIQLSGLASGMDTNAVISQLLTLERAPRARIELRQVAVQARQDALKDVATQLGKLKDAALALRSAATWGDVQSVESSDPARVAVRATAGAAPGGHQIAVTSLASGDQRHFTFTSQPEASQLTVGASTIDLAAGATLGDAVAAINADADAGVMAVDVGGRLVLSSRTTGATTSAQASGAALAEDTAKHRPGADAAFSVDGVAGTSPTNVVSTAIAGIELTLKGPTASAVSVTVGGPGPDQAGIQARVKAFVEAYNGTLDIVRAKLSEKVVPNATTSTDAKRGALFGDTNLRAVLTSLREVAGSLGELGISTGASTGAASSPDALAGKLVLDSAELTERLASDPTEVRRLLGGVADVRGLSHQIEDIVAPQTKADGVLAGRQSAMTDELSGIKGALARFDSRLARKEEALRARFSALEMALARSQAQQQDFAARLGLNNP